jgi:hypothetical protein
MKEVGVEKREKRVGLYLLEEGLEKEVGGWDAELSWSCEEGADWVAMRS